MPWQEESTMQLRRQFVQDIQRGLTPVTELAQAYGISRKTAYKWLRRYDAGGVAALADRSRRPQTSPHATPPDLVRELRAACAGPAIPAGPKPRWTSRMPSGPPTSKGSSGWAMPVSASRSRSPTAAAASC